MFSDSFIGMCWKGCWASRRRWLETWTMTRTRSCWSRRGAGEVQCNWVWREGVGGGGQRDIKVRHGGWGDFKQVGNVTHALLCNVMLEGKKSMWCGDGEAGEKCDACGLGGILNAVGRDKNVLEEVGKKCRRKTRKTIRWWIRWAMQCMHAKRQIERQRQQCTKERVQNPQSRKKVRKGGTPPPRGLNGPDFSEKLTEKGGYPPSP